MEVAYSFLCEAVRVDPDTARIDIDALDVRFFQAESLPTTNVNSPYGSRRRRPADRRGRPIDRGGRISTGWVRRSVM